MKLTRSLETVCDHGMRNWYLVMSHWAKGDMERGIFQAGPLSPLIFVICLTHHLRSAESGYEFASNEQKVNHFSWMTWNGMPGVKTGSLFQTVRVLNENIGMEFINEKCVTLNIRGNIAKFKENNYRMKKSWNRWKRERTISLLTFYRLARWSIQKRNKKLGFFRLVRNTLEAKLNDENIILSLQININLLCYDNRHQFPNLWKACYWSILSC